MMHPLVSCFFKKFQESFRPSRPEWTDDEKDRIVSGVWTRGIEEFLDQAFLRLAKPIARKKNLALVSDSQGKCYAIRWVLNDNDVNKKFASEELPSLFGVLADCHIAVVHTRADRLMGDSNANESIQKILEAYGQLHGTNQPAGLIEIRRMNHNRDSVTFRCTCTDLGSGDHMTLEPWPFS